MGVLSKKFELGQKASGCQESGIDSKTTKPPAYYTEGTLIHDLKTAAKFLRDPAQKEALAEADGIGTPATRASIIKELITGGYVAKKGSKIISQPLGRSLVKLAPQELVDPGNTARWEYDLKLISEGKSDSNAFFSALKNQVASTVNSFRGRSITLDGAKKTGPIKQVKCAATGCMEGGELSLIEGKFGLFWSCSNREQGCKHKFTTDSQQNPVFKPEDAPIKPMDGHGQPCTKCKKGKMTTRIVKKEGSTYFGKTFLSCDSRSCDNSIFPQIDNPDIEPLSGTGQACRNCATGKLVTRRINKAGPNQGKRMLVCSESCGVKPVFEEQIPPTGIPEPKQLSPDLNKPWRLPGEGKPCPACGTPLVTQRVPTSNTKSGGKRYLQCANPTCNKTIWENQAVRMF